MFQLANPATFCQTLPTRRGSGPVCLRNSRMKRVRRARTSRSADFGWFEYRERGYEQEPFGAGRVGGASGQAFRNGTSAETYNKLKTRS